MAPTELLKADLFNVALFLAIISTAFTVIGILFWWRGSHLLKRGKQIEAPIIEYVLKKSKYVSNTGSGYYVPIVQFYTDQQELITYQLRWPVYKGRVGRKIDIIYDPKEPTNIMINDDIILVIMPRILVTIGIAGYILDILLSTRIIPLPF